jgi:hypothetical protein
MTPMRAPRWIRVVSAAVGCAALVLSGFCFFAPELLFGVDAYHLLTRVAVGLLGATSGGLGVMAVMAAVEGEVAVLRAVVLALFIALALFPPVVLYNIGAFNQTDPSGWWAFGLVGAMIVGVSLPLLLSLLVLNRLRRVAAVGAAPQTRPASRAVRSAGE